MSYFADSERWRRRGQGACRPLLTGLLTAVCLLQGAHAADVTITITGTVLSGTDVTGVFGFPPNTDLTGNPYTVTFTFDDTKGTEVFAAGGSYIKNTGTSNPGTAVLLIGNGTSSFAFGTSSNSQSSVHLTADGDVNDSSYSVQAGEATLDSHWNNIQGTIYPATGTALTTNPSWEAPFSDSNLYVSPVPSNNYSLTFGIDELESNVLTQSASGSLTVNSIAVSGPITCSSVNVSLFPGGGGLLNTPQIMLAKFTAPTGTLLTYANACGFSGFNWQQQITIDPGGNTTPSVRPNQPSLLNPQNIASNGALVAPPPYYDPPPGGYIGSELNPYPFYYPAQPEPPIPIPFLPQATHALSMSRCFVALAFTPP